MAKRWQSKKERALAYAFLVERDGETCRLCGIAPPEVVLEIDHVHGHDAFIAERQAGHIKTQHLQLLCPTCNKLKDPGGRPRQPDHECVPGCVCVIEQAYQNSPTGRARDVINYQAGTIEVRLNDVYEGKFTVWLLEEIRAKGKVEKREAIVSGAYMVGCSPATSGRYVDKITSEAGPLTLTRDEMRTWWITAKDAKRR